MENSFKTALDHALKATNRSLRSVATQSGVSYEQLKALMQGKAQKTNFDDGVKVVSAFGVSVEQFLGGGISSDPAADVEPEPAGTMIDVFDVAASAGHGAVVDGETVIERLSFPLDYLSRFTRTHPRHLKIIAVKGDSMEPTLKDDDVVMLDTTKTSLDYDGLFVLRWGDALHVKRVGRAANGSVRIISDNKDIYPPIEMPRAEITVVGKVIWMGKKV
ncbi:S24 family peptidase [Rhodobacter capsulatus]|uniref:S24 family peptidase n=1 Tax=Rhodobacter capsulatus TaxID=1061 RepID=UPI0003D2D02A|nr:S24 family peptidase [Rhodobacter capsulatus]ETD89820.1 peptidase S24 [Rhodobacter capsulatus YW2]